MDIIIKLISTSWLLSYLLIINTLLCSVRASLMQDCDCIVNVFQVLLSDLKPTVRAIFCSHVKFDISDKCEFKCIIEMPRQTFAFAFCLYGELVAIFFYVWEIISNFLYSIQVSRPFLNLCVTLTSAVMVKILLNEYDKAYK